MQQLIPNTKWATTKPHHCKKRRQQILNASAAPRNSVHKSWTKSMTKGSLIESNTHQKIVTESYSWDFKPSSCYSWKRTRSSATHKTELVQCLGLPEVTTHSTYYLLEPPPKSTSPEAPPTTSVRWCDQVSPTTSRALRNSGWVS